MKNINHINTTRNVKKFLLMLILILSVFQTLAYAEDDMSKEVLSEYNSLYGDSIQNGLDEIEGNNIDEFIPGFDAETILNNIASGKTDMSISGILNSGLKFLMGEVYRSLKIMALVLALSILCAYLTNLKSSFNKDGVEQIAFFACYIIIAGIATAAFYDIAKCAGTAIGNMSAFMNIMVPIMVTTLLTSGAVISASVFEPLLLTVVEITMTVITTVFLPFVMLSSAMNIVNNLSDKFKAERLTKLLGNGVKWGLTIMLTVFVGVVGIQSIAASGADGLSVKITKFAASNFIPVVGGVLAESVETVLSCSVVIKNSVGVLGIIIMTLIAATPLLKIIATLIIFRLTAAISEPIADPKIVQCITELANSIGLIFSMLAAVTIMFIIVITIMLNAGNTAVLLGR